MDFEPAYSRYPLATVNQRLGALIIDFLSCWFISELIQSLLSLTSPSPLGFVVFAVTWFIFRVLVAARGQGQSFGRWLLSIRVIDAEFGKTAGFAAFFKREIFVFVCSLSLIATITSTLIVFAWIPFAADAAFAIVDNEKRQAFHDRISSTISIQSRKGFQLDQKMGKLFNQAGQQANKLYQSRQDNRQDDRQNGRQERDQYQTSNQRTQSKRRPRSKTRPPQDYDREYEPYEDPLETSYGKNAYSDADDDDYQDRYRSNSANIYEDETPPKRSARRPRRR